MQSLTTSESKIESNNRKPDGQTSGSSEFNERSKVQPEGRNLKVASKQRVAGFLAQLAFALSVVALAELCSSGIYSPSIVPPASRVTIYAVISFVAFSVLRYGYWTEKLRQVGVFAQRHPIWKGFVTIAILTLGVVNIVNIFALFQIECEIKQFIVGQGNLRIAEVATSPLLWTGQDDPSNAARSSLIVLEDGTAFNKPHRRISKILKSGSGRYCHWGAYGESRSKVYFSSSDNSDPLTNGRKYTIKCPVMLNPIIFNTWVMCLVGLLSSWLLLPVGERRKTIGFEPTFPSRHESLARLKSLAKGLAEYFIYATPLPFLVEHGLVGLPVLAAAVSGVAFILYAINRISAQAVSESNFCSLAACTLLTLIAVSLAVRSEKVTPEQVASVKKFLIEHRIIQTAISLGIAGGATMAIANLLKEAISTAPDTIIAKGLRVPCMVNTELLNPYLAYLLGFGCLFVAWRCYSYLSASTCSASTCSASTCSASTCSASTCSASAYPEPTNSLMPSAVERKDRTAQTGWMPGFIVFTACLAVGVGACYRTYNISSKPFWQDEAFTTSVISSRGFDLESRSKMKGKPYTASAWKELDSVQETTITASIAEVLHNLSVKDPPDQAPLYYIACRLVGKWFDYSDFSMRLVAVIAGLVSMPLVFVLTRRMFANPLCAWMALAIVASSPFQFVYSQEARPYTVWLCFFLLSFIALDHAIKTGKPRNWVLFGCASAMTCLSHLSSVLLTAATVLPLIRGKYKQLSANLLLGLLSFAIVFTQWFALTGIGIAKSGQSVWLNSVLPGRFYFGPIFVNLQAIFFDIPDLNLRLPIVLLEVACVIFAYRRATPLGRNVILSAWLFVLLVGMLDFTIGGLRLTVARYLMPSVCILQICVAASIVEIFRTKRFVLAIFALLFLGGQFYSCFLIDRSASWLPKGPHDGSLISLLNQAERGLFIESNHQQLLAIRRYVNPSVMLELVESGSSPVIPAETTRIVLEDPHERKGEFISKIKALGWKAYTWPNCPIVLFDKLPATFRLDPQEADAMHHQRYRDGGVQSLNELNK